MKNTLVIIFLAFLLEGCFFVVGAAAGAAGVAVVYDHRKLENIIIDQHIASDVSQQIKFLPTMNQSSHIEVSSFNQVVLLTGETPHPTLRQQAGEVAGEIPGVKKVYNEITIKIPVSSLTQASDAWITTKIKTQMLATKGLASGTIKVVTSNGSVYLMGIVNHKQADIAVDIARQVSGVQRVVKIFQYK